MALYETLIEGGHEHLIDAVKARIAQKADAIIEDELKPIIENQPSATLEGELLVAEDAADLPPVMVGVDGRSTQNGTPTPDAPVPIESVENPVLTVAGANMLYSPRNHDVTTYGMTWHFDELGRFHAVSGTASSTRTVVLYAFEEPLRLPAGDYLFTFDAPKTSSGSETKGPGIRVLHADGTRDSHIETFSTRQASPVLLTLAEGDVIDAIVFAQNSGSTYSPNYTYSPRLWPATSEDRGYEPYVGHTVPLYDGTLRSLPDGTKDTLALSYLRPSTREGWAWYSGEVTQSVGEVDLGALPWGPAAKDGKWVTNVPNMAGNVNATKRMCSHYTVVASQSTNDLKPDKTIGPRNVNTSTALYLRDDDYPPSTTAPSVLEEALTGVQYTFIVATLTTTTLDPIELPVLPAPNCTVWSDPTANLKLTYVIDSETIEESLESSIGKAFSSVAPVETSPATDSHGVGSRIVYNETLHKVTSAIAAGEDIVPGTNVTATTVAAELLATQA